MSFLQPFILWALTLAVLPVIIHLIHQRRFRTINWGAMYFLRKAQQNTRGMARLKQWLILLMRVLALLALALAISRPMSGGWLGLAGAGNPPLAIILLDRSPSMEQIVGLNGETKREVGLKKIIEACKSMNSSRAVLIENVGMKPVEVVDIDSILELSIVNPSDKAANLPIMIQSALEYIATNKPGNCQIWICSDLKLNDWDPENGLWASIRDEFPNLKDNIQVLLVPLTQTEANNIGVEIQSARRIVQGDQNQLQLSLKFWKSTMEGSNDSFPLDVNINGNIVRTQIGLDSREAIFEDLVYNIDPSQTNGWGWARVPSDDVLSDNTTYFSYQPFVYTRTLIVHSSPVSDTPLVWMVESSPDGELKNSVQVISMDQLTSVDLSEISLILWNAPLPNIELQQKTVAEFVENGGYFMAFPQESRGGNVLGLEYDDQIIIPDKSEISMDRWKTDSDLLAHAMDGTTLPLGELRILRFCGIKNLSSEMQVLARLSNGEPFLSKYVHGDGAIYMCATSPDPEWSDLSSSGIVLYAMIHRALNMGTDKRQGQNMRFAGEVTSTNIYTWHRIAGSEQTSTLENASTAGVYMDNRGEYVAINRSPNEAQSPYIGVEKVELLFENIPLQILGRGQESTDSDVIQEIWRVCLLSMVAFLLVESWLSFPSRRYENLEKYKPGVAKA